MKQIDNDINYKQHNKYATSSNTTKQTTTLLRKDIGVQLNIQRYNLFNTYYIYTFARICVISHTSISAISIFFHMFFSTI